MEIDDQDTIFLAAQYANLVYLFHDEVALYVAVSFCKGDWLFILQWRKVPVAWLKSEKERRFREAPHKERVTEQDPGGIH